MSGSLICKVSCCDDVEMCNKPRACKNEIKSKWYKHMLYKDGDFNSSCIRGVDYENIYFAGSRVTVVADLLVFAIVLVIFLF